MILSDVKNPGPWPTVRQTKVAAVQQKRKHFFEPQLLHAFGLNLQRALISEFFPDMKHTLNIFQENPLQLWVSFHIFHCGVETSTCGTCFVGEALRVVVLQAQGTTWIACYQPNSLSFHTQDDDCFEFVWHVGIEKVGQKGSM